MIDEPIESTPHVGTIEEIEAMAEEHLKLIQRLVDEHNSRM